MQKFETYFLLKSFLIWRVLFFVAAFAAIFFIPVFGARFPYYDRVLEITKLPNWIWGFGNFDGVHYLRIAQDGYLAQYSQAFFPLYPVLIRIFSYIFPRNPAIDPRFFVDPAYFYSGFMLSNILFVAALFMYYRLVKLDFKRDVAVWSVILLLAFPTSYYFGAVYTESLFILLTAASIYLMRKQNFFWSAVIIGLATATRIVGVFLIPVYVVEVLKVKKKINLLWTLIAPLGILGYMYFLKINFGNPLYFLTAQPVFGASRLSEGLILLPQVIYRYLKIFFTTNIISLPFLNAFLEFIFTLGPLTLLLIFFRKIRLSYWIFAVCTLIAPTLTGTFSSMPRYAIVSIFLVLPYLVEGLKGKIKLVVLISGLIGLLLVGLFTRGYWVA